MIRGKQEVIDSANGMFAAVPDITVELRSTCVSRDHSAREYEIKGT